VSDAIRQAAAELRRRPGRFLGQAGAAGTLALALVLVPAALGAGAVDQAARLEHMGTHFTLALPPDGPDPDALAAALRQSPAVADAIALAEARLALMGGGTVRAIAYDAADSLALAANVVKPADCLAGRLPDPASADEVALQLGFARSRSLGPGGRIVLNGQAFTVCGIVDTGVRPVMAEVFLPAASLGKLLAVSPAGSPAAALLAVEARTPADMPAALEAAAHLVPGGLSSGFACWRAGQAAIDGDAATLAAVPPLLAGGLAALTLVSTLAGLARRRRDFGILRSCGWGVRAIGTQLVAEACLPSLAGAVAGTALACLAWPPLAAALGWTAGLPGIWAAAAVVLPAATAVAAVLPPVLRFGRQPPADLLAR
jgi:hypothetical protein